MKPYRDWSPTAYDCKGLGGAALTGQQDWLVVDLIVTRDSGPLEQSNFETAAFLIADAAVMDDEQSMDTHRFAHWGPGWFELILVRPGSKAAAEAQRIEDKLAGYPILDEDDLSEREMVLASETWAALNIADRVRAIQKYGDGNVFAARRDEVPNDPTGSLHQYLGE